MSGKPEANDWRSWELVSSNGATRLTSQPHEVNPRMSSVRLVFEPHWGAEIVETAEFSDVAIDRTAFDELRNAVRDLLAGPFEIDWYRSWRYTAEELSTVPRDLSLSIAFGPVDGLILDGSGIGCCVTMRGSRVQVRSTFATDPTCLATLIGGET